MSVPKLRFKADDGSEFPEWEHFTVRDLFSLIKDTNTDSKNKNVITNSAEMGLIPQREFFDKDIAVEGSIDKYTVIRLGDFVYNPRKSQTAPYGPFNCYTGKVDGIVSPLYFCLRPKYPNTTAYMLRYFSSPVWYPYIYNHGAQGGARHDRVGMTNELLLNIPVSLPCEEEQAKIAKILSALDHVIDQTQSELDAWEKQKRGVMQLLFNRKVRLKADDGSEFPKWTAYHLSDFTERVTRKNEYEETDIPLTISSQYGLVDQRNYFSKTIAAKDMSGYFLLKKGEFAYNKSSSVGYEYGAIKRLDNYKQGAVSTLYICFSILDNSIVDSDFVAYYFDSNKWNAEAKLICAEGARNHGLLNVSPVDFFNISVYIPKSIMEQQKIAACLSAFDDVIDKTKKELDAYRKLKKGLLQQMFV